MDFPISEYERRYASLQKDLDRLEIDALILTGEKNIRYVSGYHNQGWVSPTRARYLVVPAGDSPIAVIPSTNVRGFEQLSWVKSIRDWPAPRPQDDGVSLVVDAVMRSGKRKVPRIGIESGPESRWQAPLVDLLSIQQRLGEVQYVDAHSIMRKLRLIKSDLEIGIMKNLAQTVSLVLDDTEGFGAQDTELDLYFHLLGKFVSHRIERAPYLIVTSGDSGYEQINTGPLTNALESGSSICVDTGCSSAGYFCDITRNYQFGEMNPSIRAAYDLLYRATDAALAAVRPGVTARGVWQAMANEIGDSASSTPVGRMGHGIGLDMTEGPSISASDETPLRAGMTITIEPSFVFTEVGRRKIMVHEENVAVTDRGVELLSRRAPREIHSVPI